MKDEAISVPRAIGVRQGLPARLDSCLPEFTRVGWVSDAARAAWEPRIERIRRAWTQAEWLSVAAKVRRCALIAFPRSELEEFAAHFAKHGLSAVDAPLPASTHPGLLFAFVGALDTVREAREAWSARLDERLGELFGYPECCRRFFQKVWTELDCRDTTWHMAANSAPATHHIIDVRAGDPALANILWRWIGVRAVPHLPCRFDCEASQALGERMLGVMEEMGARAEVDSMREILAWPLEWSALHGIAEIKTPLLRLCTRTDASGVKLVVRKHGDRYPVEGSIGLHFPFQTPDRTRLTEGRGFQIALKRSLVAEKDEGWLYRENGFASLEAMQKLHAPIVGFVREVLGEGGGRVLDLGCGNGALLDEISKHCRKVEPYGVEYNSVAVQHARQALPRFYSNISVGDIFDESVWASGRRYALTLLMPGRLLEVEVVKAARLIEHVEAHSDAVVLYAYPDRAHGSLAALAGKAGLQLREGGQAAASVALLRRSAGVKAAAIDWLRMAEPQEDQYDTGQIARLMTSRGPGSPPLPADSAAECTTFDGAVRIAHVYRGMPEFSTFTPNYLDAPLHHPNIAAAAEYVRLWPGAFAQCKRLLAAIHPAVDTSIPFNSREIYRGSTCHSFESYLGTLWSTIHCPYGLAEAIVHEMAHQKLRAMGVSFESVTRIVGNDPVLLYVSPIVKDRLRPMSAVLHAQYSYVHVTALDILLVRAEEDPVRRAALKDVLRRNLARIGEGAATLAAQLVPGRDGKEFMAGLDTWTERIAREGTALIS